MHKVSDQPASGAKELQRLHNDFPDWVFTHRPGTGLAWGAKRLLYRKCNGGGVAGLHADTPERLRGFLVGVAALEAPRTGETAP